MMEHWLAINDDLMINLDQVTMVHSDAERAAAQQADSGALDTRAVKPRRFGRASPTRRWWRCRLPLPVMRTS